MKILKYNYSDLVCLNCGNIVTIQRKVGNARPVGHIKDLYCYKCLEVTKHYEVRDVSNFLYNYNVNKEEEVNVCKLILGRRKND